MPPIVACPHCAKTLEWKPANAYRPFCSERCKLIDLGAWAAGGYSVPSVESADHADDPAPAGPVTR